MIRIMNEIDLENISQLEKETYSYEMSLGYEDFKYDFHHYKQHSYIGEINGDLQAYIFAYEKRNKIYISDFVCKNTGMLLPIWIVFCKENENKICFAECRKTAYLLLKRLSQWVEIKEEKHWEDYYEVEDAYYITFKIKPILNQKHNILYEIYKNEVTLEELEKKFQLNDNEQKIANRELRKANKLK